MLFKKWYNIRVSPVRYIKLDSTVDVRVLLV